MSMPPSSSSARAAKPATASRSARSTAQDRDSGADGRQSASTRSSRSARRAQIPTVHPADARSRAMAAPIPADAPVTSARFPVTDHATERSVGPATGRLTAPADPARNGGVPIIPPGQTVYGIQLPIQSQSSLYAEAWEATAGPDELIAVARAADDAGCFYVGVCDHVAIPRRLAPAMGT